MGRSKILAGAIEQEGRVLTPLTSQRGALSGAPRPASDFHARQLTQQVIQIGRPAQVQGLGRDRRGHARVFKGVQLGVCRLNDDDLDFGIGCRRRRLSECGAGEGDAGSTEEECGFHDAPFCERFASTPLVPRQFSDCKSESIAITFATLFSSHMMRSS